MSIRKFFIRKSRAFEIAKSIGEGYKAFARINPSFSPEEVVFDLSGRVCGENYTNILLMINESLRKYMTDLGDFDASFKDSLEEVICEEMTKCGVPDAYLAKCLLELIVERKRL